MTDYDIGYNDGYKAAMKSVKDLIDRDCVMPVKEELYDEEGGYVVGGICPSCGMQLQGESFCSECGQRLSWGNEQAEKEYKKRMAILRKAFGFYKE